MCYFVPNYGREMQSEGNPKLKNVMAQKIFKNINKNEYNLAVSLEICIEGLDI